MARRLGEQRGQPGVALTPAEFQHCIDPLLSTDPSPVSTELGPFPFAQGEYVPDKYRQANVEHGLCGVTVYSRFWVQACSRIILKQARGGTEARSCEAVCPGCSAGE